MYLGEKLMEGWAYYSKDQNLLGSRILNSDIYKSYWGIDCKKMAIQMKLDVNAEH